MYDGNFTGIFARAECSIAKFKSCFDDEEQTVDVGEYTFKEGTKKLRDKIPECREALFEFDSTIYTGRSKSGFEEGEDNTSGESGLTDEGESNSSTGEGTAIDEHSGIYNGDTGNTESEEFVDGEDSEYGSQEFESDGGSEISQDGSGESGGSEQEVGGVQSSAGGTERESVSGDAAVEELDTVDEGIHESDRIESDGESGSYSGGDAGVTETSSGQSGIVEQYVSYTTEVIGSSEYNIEYVSLGACIMVAFGLIIGLISGEIMLKRM